MTAYILDFKVGTEIETGLRSFCTGDAGRCSYCEDCELTRDLCNNCTEYIRDEVFGDFFEMVRDEWDDERAHSFSVFIQEISVQLERARENLRRAIIENRQDDSDFQSYIGIIEALSNGDVDELSTYIYRCDLCTRSAVIQDMISEEVCERCHPCDYCDSYSIDTSSLEVLRPYHDGSCGMEIPTKPLMDLHKYRNLLRHIVYDLNDYVCPSYGAGGHINLSWENSSNDDVKKTAAYAILKYADLLAYMFLYNNTYERDPDYRAFSTDFYRKYNIVHFKSFGIEVRFPDTPVDPDNHTLLTAVLLAIAVNAEAIKEHNFGDKMWTETRGRYEDIIEEGIFHYHEEYEEKFKALYDTIEHTLNELSPIWDLPAAFVWRFYNPAYRKEIALDSFKKNDVDSGGDEE